MYLFEVYIRGMVSDAFHEFIFSYLQLIDYLDRYGIIEEGILRVPGSASRIKVTTIPYTAA